MLQLRYACRCRVLRANASIQCCLLGLHATLIHRQTGRALIHAYEGYASGLLQILGNEQHLANCGVREVGNVQLLDCAGNQFFAEYLHFSSTLLR